MSHYDFERESSFRSLRAIEVQIAAEIDEMLGDSAHNWRAGALDWIVKGYYGERVRRLREALKESEEIALRSLRKKLGDIELRIIWPLLVSLCCDLALYMGGGAVLGGAAGAGFGFFFGGIGAFPGALSGMVLGSQAGSILLGFFGLKSTVEHMAESLPRAVNAYVHGFQDAWGPVPRRGVELHHSDFVGCDYCRTAADDFAYGHEVLILALLSGFVAYLSFGRGRLPALLSEIRQNSKLGPKMADWLAQNERKLVNHPLLQTGNKNGGAPEAMVAGKPIREHDSGRKGVFGEVKADEYMDGLGFEKLDKGGRLTKIDDAPAGHGIDSLWKNRQPPPDFVIVDAKFGSGSLGMTRDGKQMSDDWLLGDKTGFDRIKKALDFDVEMTEKIQESLRKGGVEKWILRVDGKGVVKKSIIK